VRATGTGSPPSPPAPGKASSRTWSLRHRRRARCEDRIRCAKDTGLRSLPLQGFAQNQVWCEIVALACELLAWTQLLALTGTARRWEPKRLRLRLFSVAGRAGPRRPPPAAAAGRTLALGRADRRCGHPPAGPAIWLTSRNHHCDQGRSNPGPVEPPPAGATAGQPATART
jgi:DDE family transposase